jgi:hypothetical protein
MYKKTKPLLDKSGFKLNPEQIITVLNIFNAISSRAIKHSLGQD